MDLHALKRIDVFYSKSKVNPNFNCMCVIKQLKMAPIYKINSLLQTNQDKYGEMKRGLNTTTFVFVEHFSCKKVLSSDNPNFTAASFPR